MEPGDLAKTRQEPDFTVKLYGVFEIFCCNK
jgi:hypothetical protein